MGNKTSSFSQCTDNATKAHEDQIPFSPLRHPSMIFTGQDMYLEQLKDHFTTVADGGRRYFLLYGMGGIGKTQICLKFIEQNLNLFSHIFWIDSSSESTIDLCLRQIARAENLDEPSASSALDWISKRADWLMVYDDADGGYHVLQKFFPPGTKGNILITSRDIGFKRLTLEHSLEVEQMKKEEAVSLLIRSTMLDDDYDKIRSLAEPVVAELGYIPLAINQAGAYILSHHTDEEGFVELFKKQPDQLLSDDGFKGASNYGYSTYGAWEISIQEIERRAASQSGQQAVAAQSALILCRIFAFLHYEHITEEFFKSAAWNYGKKMGKGQNGLPHSISVLDVRTLFLNEAGGWDRLKFQSGIQLLQSFSLIKNSNEEYSMHPLVHTWSMKRIPMLDRAKYCKDTSALLSCAICCDLQQIVRLDVQYQI